MPKVATLASIEPNLFLDGEPAVAANARAALEMVNWALAETCPAWAFQIRSDFPTTLLFDVEIPPWARELRIDAQVIPLDVDVATQVIVTVGAASATLNTSPGGGDASATLLTSATGTGQLAVDVSGTVTAGSGARLRSLAIRTQPVAAADLPDPFP